jgi:replicative DNA helicase
MTFGELDERIGEPPRASLEEPPHDHQAEEAVLGSILKNPASIHEIVDILVPDAFYERRHRLVFTAALSLARQEAVIDYHTLLAELQRQGTYDEAGGLEYVAAIQIGTPTAAFIEHYARIVADHYVRRLAVQTYQRNTDIAWRAAVPVVDMLTLAQTEILGLSDRASGQLKTSTASDAIGHWLDAFGAERPENDRGDKLVGVSTGLRSLDKMTLGLQPARLYLLPAYTSVGKSQLAHQVALHVARNHGPVLMVSLEMSESELTTRAIAMETSIPAETLDTGELSDRQATAVLAAAERQQADPLHYLDGVDGLTTAHVRSRAVQLQAQCGRLALIVLDYGQLLQDSKGSNSTVEDQTLVSRNLKRIARALNVPLLVPVQINRQAGQRADHRPRLSDIRESGSWEQDSDVVISLYRDELVNPDTKDRGLLELSVLKNRHTGQRPPFTAKAVWHGGRYWEWEHNSYAGSEPTRVPRGVAAAFNDSAPRSARMPYADP